MDVFLAANSIPIFITNILSGSLTFTFIPIFAQYRAEQPGETWNVVSSFLNISAVVTAVICLIGMLMSTKLIALVAPGFDAEKVARAGELLAWLFPVVLFSLVNELLASIYYSNNRFVIPSLNKVIGPFITVTYVLFFRDTLNTKSIVFAILTAGILQAAILSVGFLWTKEFKYSFVMDLRHPGILKIFSMITPLVAGMLVYKAGPVADAFFLSTLPSGSISSVGYAFKLISTILPLIVTGISISVFPTMSAYAAQQNWDAFAKVIVKSLRMLLFLSVPFVVLFGIYGRPVIQLIFERGAFRPQDTTAVYHAFVVYLFALPAAAAGSIVSQGFYALQRTSQISAIGVGMMFLYLALCYILVGPLGYLAIPVSYALYQNCAVSLTSLVLKNKIPQRRSGVIEFAVKTLVAAAAAAAIVYYPMTRTSAYALASSALCAVGFVFYFLIGKFVFSLEEAKLISRFFAENLQRRDTQ